MPRKRPTAVAGAASATRRTRARTGQVLAEVQSATLRQQVDLMLQTSDNYLAEVLGRMAAVAAGQPGSNDGATATVYKQVQDLGIPTDGLRVADVSGLSLGNQVSAGQLSEIVRAITSGTEPSLRAAIGGFPVAGLTGTLGSRYTDASTEGGAGLVRAKTGTLNSVIALSGYVVDADGRLLVFSFIGNGLAPGAAGNSALDRRVGPGLLRLPLPARSRDGRSAVLTALSAGPAQCRCASGLPAGSPDSELKAQPQGAVI